MQFNQRILAAIMFILPASMHAVDIPTKYLVVSPFEPDSTLKWCQKVQLPSEDTHIVKCTAIRQRDQLYLIQTKLDVLNKQQCAIAAFGICAGASALAYALPQLDCSRIKTVFLESPWDNFTNLVADMCCCCPSIVSRCFARWCCKYDVGGRHPVTEIGSLPSTLSVNFFVIDGNDMIVPIKRTKALYNAIHVAKNWLVFRGAHSLLAQNQNYPRIVHELLRQHKLQCDAVLAKEGAEIFAIGPQIIEDHDYKTENTKS